MPETMSPREKVAAAIRVAVGEFRMSGDMADSAASAALAALQAEQGAK